MRLAGLLIALWSGVLLAQTLLARDPPKYTGPGSCASPSCHGGVQVRTDTSVQQNEYSTWVVKDKHAHAFAVLTNPVATRMAKILGIDKADTAPKCLACHALNVPEADRARTFDSTDGVSCESCHGPASNWLGPHTTKGWTHERSIAAGMRDLRDPVRRAENCLACHLGTADKAVDHEMIAAGHPDLYFELASFTAAMPRHWKEHAATIAQRRSLRRRSDAGRWTGRSIARAVAARRRATRKGTSGPNSPIWIASPAITALTNAENSWRQEQGYAGRRAGNPPWNLSRYAVLRQIVNEMDREGGGRLETEVDKLYAIMSSVNPGPQSGRRASTRHLRSSGPSGATDSGVILRPGPHAAIAPVHRARCRLHFPTGRACGGTGDHGAAVALSSPTLRQAHPTNDTQIRAALKALFQQVENPSAYNAPKFAEAMRALSQVLP